MVAANSVTVEIMEKLLTTKEVAKVLQSSESSVKRWCDQGTLNAVRTPGGHRRVPMASVLEFARSKGKIEPAAELLGIAPTAEAIMKASASHKTLVDAFLADDTKTAEAIILSAFANGMSIEKIADDLVAPAMEEIGHGWETGTVAIHKERRACGMVEQALARIASSMPPLSEDAPKAIGATLQNDHYTLASKLGALTLQQNGWDARLLGSNLPMYAIVRAVNEWQADMLWLSFSHVDAEQSMINEFNEIAQPLIERGISIVIGGRCADFPLRNKLVYTFYGTSMRSLASFSRGAPRKKNIA